jgi:hypothetical protein
MARGKMKNISEEGAPTVNVGGGDIAGVGIPKAGKAANWGEPGVSPRHQPKKNKTPSTNSVVMSLVRRVPPNMVAEDSFAGNVVFEVSSNVFHNLKLEKRKGQHWKTYLGEDDVLSEIREYANKNPHKPIIVRNVTTNEMCYVRYGRKGR